MKKGSWLALGTLLALYRYNNIMGIPTIKKKFTSITVELPVGDDISQLEPPVMFEMIKQLVANGIGCHPDSVWVKSVNHITEFEKDPVPPGYS